MWQKVSSYALYNIGDIPHRMSGQFLIQKMYQNLAQKMDHFLVQKSVQKTIHFLEHFLVLKYDQKNAPNFGSKFGSV